MLSNIGGIGVLIIGVALMSSVLINSIKNPIIIELQRRINFLEEDAKNKESQLSYAREQTNNWKNKYENLTWVVGRGELEIIQTTIYAEDMTDEEKIKQIKDSTKSITLSKLRYI